MSVEEIITPSPALSLKDVNEIEMVSQKIGQAQQIKASVNTLNQNGQLDDLQRVTDEILDQLKEGHNELLEKKDRIEKLDETVKQLELLPKTCVLIALKFFCVPTVKYFFQGDTNN